MAGGSGWSDMGTIADPVFGEGREHRSSGEHCRGEYNMMVTIGLKGVLIEGLRTHQV